MAAITLTRVGTFAVRWRSGGVNHAKSFKTKQEAKKFLAIVSLSPEDKAKRVTLSVLMDEYLKDRTKKKKSSRTEGLRIEAFKRRPFAKKYISDITTKDIQDFIDIRLTEYSPKTGGTISPGTVIREIKILSSVFFYAYQKKLIKENPCTHAKKPKEPDHRWRVASIEDREKLIVASGWDGKSAPRTDGQWTVLMFLFACATGMRVGEILKIEKTWVKGNVIRIPFEATKTDARREIGLSTEALRLLKIAMDANPNEVIFGVMKDADRDTEFRKVRNRAGLAPVKDSKGRIVEEGLNFHDSRATFCTWAASQNPETGRPRLELLDLARQTGHKDLKQLQKYYRATAEEIAKRLG